MVEEFTRDQSLSKAEILIKIARRFGAGLNEGGMAARIGCDNFVLLLRGTGDVRAEAAAMLASLKQPLLANGHQIFSSASIGTNLYSDHDDD